MLTVEVVMMVMKLATIKAVVNNTNKEKVGV